MKGYYSAYVKVVTGKDGLARCAWAGEDELYIRYHDDEWGFPVKDDQRLFEKICLEGFQSGLSWITILRKRENFRRAFDGFDFQRVARFGKREINRLMKDAGIVRHRGKIESTIKNAKNALQLQREFGSIARYVWQWEKTPDAARELSKDLKKRGWAFVGPTTVYSFLQAMGLVNDHAEGCSMRDKVDEARRRFARP